MIRGGILNLSKEELVQILNEHNIPSYRASQIFVWLYRYGAKSFDEMTNISKDLRLKLDGMFNILIPEIVTTSSSADGTTKFLLKLRDSNTIETVLIPDPKRNTICVSSQVGCAVGCKFCNTGYNGFIRNLETEEIIAQYLTVKNYLDAKQDGKRITNIVFMGMGEPLYNIENVLKSIDLLIADEQSGISRRKITVSTSGITPILKKISKGLKTKLAISLHAPNDEIRSKIMPVNDLYPLDGLISTCAEYCEFHPSIKITFEYLLLKDINDSAENAKELVNLIKGMNSKVNIIQFNEWPGSEFKRSPSKRVKDFARILERNGIEAPIRASKGFDIMAACGQLKSSQE